MLQTIPFSRLSLAEIAVTLTSLILLTYITVKILNFWRYHKALSKIPYDTKDCVFLFGHAPKMLRDMGAALDWQLTWAVENKWKCCRGFQGPGFDVVMALHSDTAKVVLKGDPKTDIIYHGLKPWLGEGLVTANGGRWARNRRLLTPAFHYEILKPYISVYSEAVNVMVKLWSQVPEGQSFNVFPYISLLTLDVVLRCACTLTTNCQDSKTCNSYITSIYELSDLHVKRTLFFPAYYDWIYALTPNGWKFKRAADSVHKFAMDIIQTRRRALIEGKRTSKEQESKKYLDFIDILLEAKDENGVGLTDEEIRQEVDTFVFEGHDTTAAGIAWTLYNLARYPEHQEKCRQEVDELFDQKGTLDWNDVKSLNYVKYCIKESIRLFPPVSVIGRTLDQPTEMDGHNLPAGTFVMSNIYVVHHNPDVWNDPEVFDPLRFMDENSKNRSSHAFIAFSAGPRNCIGQEFALNEEKVVIAHILRNFELTLDLEKPVKKDFLVILRPKDGLYLKLKHRKH